MVGFVKVVDTPFAAKTDARGAVELHGLPGGPGVLKVWHPYLKAAANELSESVSLPQAGAVQRSETADVRSPPIRRNSY
jgi:hypothetical protein